MGSGLPNDGVSGFVGSHGLSNQQKKQILFLHNFYRSRVKPSAANMIRLEWDPLLEAIATHHVENCNISHNTNRHNEYAQAIAMMGGSIKNNASWIGENIAWGVGNCSNDSSYIDCGDVFEGIKRWEAENKDFDLLNNQCYDQCSLYTQIIWANSSSIGCAAKMCDKNKTILVCNYHPGGNHVNQRPYLINSPCIACPSEKNYCRYNLCSKPPLIHEDTLQHQPDLMSIEVSQNTTIENGHIDSHSEITIKPQIPSGWISLNIEAKHIDIDKNRRLWIVTENDTLILAHLHQDPNKNSIKIIETDEPFVSVTSNGDTTWGLLEDLNTIMYLSGLTDNPIWYKIDSGDMRIKKIESKKLNVVWLLTQDGNLFYRSEISDENKAGVSWASIKFNSTYHIENLSCGDLACWVILTDSSVFIRYGISDVTPQGTKWINIKTKMNYLSSGYEGHLIGKLKNIPSNISKTELYFWRMQISESEPEGNAWVLLKFPSAIQISIGPSVIGIIQKNSNVIYRNSYPSEVLSDTLKIILTSNNDTNNKMNVTIDDITQNKDDRKIEDSIKDFLISYDSLVTPKYGKLDLPKVSPIPKIKNKDSHQVEKEKNVDIILGSRKKPKHLHTTPSVIIHKDVESFDTLEDAENSITESNVDYMNQNNFNTNFNTNKFTKDNKNTKNDAFKQSTDSSVDICCEIPDSLCQNYDGSCNSYIECDGMEPKIKYCGTGQIFDPYTKVCVDAWQTSYVCNSYNHLPKVNYYHPPHVEKSVAKINFIDSPIELNVKTENISSPNPKKENKKDPHRHNIPRTNLNASNHLFGVLREAWFNIPNSDVSIKGLIDDPRYPYFPDEYLILDTFEAPPNVGDYYGQRITSYYRSPLSGPFVFYLSCDDECELWIGKNYTESSLKKVAHLTKNQSTAFREWNKYPDDQITQYITLQKERFYLMQAFMRETRYKDHISVGVLKPNGLVELPINQNLFLQPLSKEEVKKIDNSET